MLEPNRFIFASTWPGRRIFPRRLVSEIQTLPLGPISHSGPFYQDTRVAPRLDARAFFALRSSGHEVEEDSRVLGVCSRADVELAYPDDRGERHSPGMLLNAVYTRRTRYKTEAMPPSSLEDIILGALTHCGLSLDRQIFERDDHLEVLPTNTVLWYRVEVRPGPDRQVSCLEGCYRSDIFAADDPPHVRPS